MSPTEAKAILKEYQEWRMGAETKQLDPVIISEAINIILVEFKPKRQIKRKLIYINNNFN